MSMIVCCSSQVLPDHFEDIAHAKAFCDVEKAARSKGSMLQGVALDVPLAVLSQQRLHVVKYYVTVPELAAADGTQHSANATLLDAARARAAERFWPSPVSNDHPENLYPGDDIPDSVLESFYRGLVFVSVKDAVFQPSSPLRT